MNKLIPIRDGVLDPPRFPKVIVPIENEAKRVFLEQNKAMVLSLAARMAKMIEG